MLLYERRCHTGHMHDVNFVGIRADLMGIEVQPHQSDSCS